MRKRSIAPTTAGILLALAGSGTFGQRLLSAAGIATAPRSTSTQIERFIVRVQGVRVSSELPPTHQGR